MELDQPDLTSVDELLFGGRRIEALATFREITGCSLQEAIESVGSRFDHLKQNSANRFTVPLADYWADFYT